MAGKKASAKAIDFSNVKERGSFNPKRVAEGDYAATIVKVEDGEVKRGENAGEFQYIITIKLEKYSQYSYPYYCKLQENQLWKLRNLAIAAGLNVPKKRMKFDPNKLAGKKIGVTMEDDDPYEGKVKSIISAVFPVSELAEGDEVVDDDGDFDEDSAVPVSADDSEDEAESKPKKKKGKKDKAKEEPPAKSEKKGKKKKSKKGSDDDIEELNIDDV